MSHIEEASVSAFKSAGAGVLGCFRAMSTLGHARSQPQFLGEQLSKRAKNKLGGGRDG